MGSIGGSLTEKIAVEVAISFISCLGRGLLVMS